MAPNAILHILSVVFVGLVSVHADAQVTRSSEVKSARSFVYHGKLVRPDGSVPDGSVAVTVKVLSPEPSNCLLWSEAQTVTVRQGSFSMELGHEVHRLSGTAGGAANDFKQVFINNPGLTISGALCASGNSYTPASTDDRLLSASFNDNGVVATIEALPIKSVPFALQAEEIGGYGLANLAKISGAGSSVVYTPAEAQSLKDLLGADIAWDMKSRLVTKVADPVANDDAANKGWVMTQLASFSGGASPIGAATGDLSGNYPAPTVAKVRGVAVSSTAPTTAGQVLKYDGSTQYAPGFIGVADIRSTVAGNAQFFPTNCTSKQTLTWESATDKMICTNIALGTADLADKVISYAKIQDVTSGRILGRSTAGNGVLEEISIGTGLSLASGTLSSTSAPATNPAFTGTPTAPTASADTNTTQLATTAFVLGQASSTNPLMDGTVAIGTSTRYARADHVHPTDTSRAPAAGSTSITTLGTITTGAWNGSTIPVVYGGTGTTTGSITAAAGSGLTFTAGSGGNYDVRLTPSGTGSTILDGSVGIGTTTPVATLDVAGAAKIGTSSTPCTPELAGTLRYNTTSNLMEYCNGTLWGEMAATTTSSGGSTSAGPEAFSFVDQGGASVNAVVVSNIIQINGHTGSAITVSGAGSPEYRICVDAACAAALTGWLSGAGSIQNAQYVQMRQTAASTVTTDRTATMTINDISTDWIVSTSTCTPGSANYTTAGTYSFTVPNYTGTLTVKVYGAGGGGGGDSSGTNGGAGGQSYFSSVIGNGGGAGLASGSGGAGGTASGGTTNTSGSAGASSSGAGGKSGGNPSNGGGAGGAAVGSSTAGKAGGAPGGGGSGGCGSTCGGGSGGGGGYSARSYAAGALTVGASISVRVGASGAKGGGGIAGGLGGRGQVSVTWTCL